MMKALTKTLAMSLAALSSGCVSLLPEADAPRPRYHIEAVEAGSLAGNRVDWALVVDDPRATRVYDTVKIAVSPARGKIEYFANAEWADRAPRLFQTALVQSFEDSGRILSVGDRGAAPIGDIVLQMDIRKMQINVQGGAETPTVTVYARLTDGKGKFYAAELFSAQETAAASNADALIAAFDTAFEKIFTDLIAWTFEEGEKAVGAGA